MGELDAVTRLHQEMRQRKPRAGDERYWANIRRQIHSGVTVEAATHLIDWLVETQPLKSSDERRKLAEEEQQQRRRSQESLQKRKPNSDDASPDASASRERTGWIDVCTACGQAIRDNGKCGCS